MPDKNFLELTPLYRKVRADRIYDHSDVGDIPKPAIHMYCDHCESEQTFNMENEYHENLQSTRTNISGIIVRAQYFCSACGRGQRIFLIKFVPVKTSYIDDDGEQQTEVNIHLMKVGQYPSWSIEMDKELEDMLGAHSGLYKKGLICESQSYGIGAFAYFRRITEEIIDDLLVSITSLIGTEDKDKYLKALEEVEKQKIADKKIQIVKDLLPPILRPDGMNPLSVIYDALSGGLHSLSDEDCMEQAEAIRSSLIFLVNQIKKTENDAENFSSSMKKLLTKKSKAKK